MKKQKSTFLMAILLTALMILGGCGGSSKSSSYYNEPAAAAEEYAYEYDYAAEEAASGMVADTTGLEEVSVPQSNRKLIKTVDLSVQTREFDELTAKLAEQVSACGGYIESSSIGGNSYYSGSSNRDASYRIRIPADKLSSFVEIVSGLGNVTHKSENVSDVTLQYTDVESHKKALVTEQDRLLELLAKAENMEDILAIESRLSEVRYQLQSYESQLRLLDNQVDYSTVDLTVCEVERITEPAEKLTFFEEVAQKFNNDLYHVGRDIRQFAIDFLGSIPSILVGLVKLAILFFVLRFLWRLWKKNKKPVDKSKKTGRNRFRGFGKKNGEVTEVMETADNNENTPNL